MDSPPPTPPPNAIEAPWGILSRGRGLPIAIPDAPDYVIFSSFGNDSIALIQWAVEKGLTSVVVAYSNTGWAAKFWPDRVARACDWVRKLGFGFEQLPSQGMVDLARSRKGWPRNGLQFCTTELKIVPAQKWLDSVDPEKESICLVGVRRAESRVRSSWPQWIEESGNHGGRSLWSPLYAHSATERDELLDRAGWDVLPHSSMECSPCVNANRNDIRMLTEDRIALIEKLEEEMGYTSKGKKRTFFRPYRHMGAIGIREVVKWAHSKRGKYKPPVQLGDGVGCDSGMCAS